MRPIKLEFEAINSFSERTVIDFEKLTKNGIFGIFGDTGSGKSTILDCINFALYGKVERSKERTDIINYRCNAAFVNFTFTVENGGKCRTYYIERSLKKDKSNSHKAFLYEDGVCIADKAQEVERKVEDILGVDAEDFRKCIALPQGEFSQFVKSAPRDKLELIERLFSLSKYGKMLKEKIADRQEKAEAEFQNISGKLSIYSDITEEDLKAAEELLEEYGKQLDVKKSALTEAKTRFNTLKILSDKKNELDGVKVIFAQLCEKRAEIEELRNGLSNLTICREAVATHNQMLAINANIKNSEEEIKKTESEYAVGENKLLQLEKSLTDGDLSFRIEELTKLCAKYQTCADKPQKLSDLNERLQSKREEYKNAERELERIKLEYTRAENSLNELEQKMRSVDYEGLERFVNTEFKGAILRNEYVATLDDLVGLNSRTKDYDDGSAFYNFIQSELKKRIEDYKQRIIDVKDFKLENVSVQLGRLQDAIKEREEFSEKIRVASGNVKDLAGKITVRQNELDALKKDGIELRNRAIEIEQELHSVFGDNCSDFEKAERNSLIELENAKKQLQSLNEKYECAKFELQELNLKRERLKSGLQALKERLCEAEEKQKSLLAETSFGSVEECEAHCRKFAGIEDAQRSLKEFDERFASASAKIKEFSAIKGIDEITPNQVKEAEEAKNTLDSELTKLNGDFAVTQSRVKDLTSKLEQKRDLTREFETAQKDRELILRLKEVVKGNKFLEFIADEYLCDISALATTTLLKLTDGRYFLTYKDNDFSVGDNFNGGALRGVNTLSGGEIFLVSLSLALALSQTICARSMKSIEFFFLDEGFGTLDSNLVDTVVTALEKLKNSHFIIGIISHVEELKHRIDSKITVIKATESHGSSVQISC